MTAAEDRLTACLIADLDSMRQATEGFSGSAPVDAIRLGLLLCDRIALPSNQILDGYHMLSLGPRGFRRLTGAMDGEPPMVVLLETETLADDLLSLLRNKMQTFHWSALDALGVGGQALQEVALDIPEQMPLAEALQQLIAAADCSHPTTGRAARWMVERWRPWLAAERAGDVQGRRWVLFEQITIDPPGEWQLPDRLIEKWQGDTRRSHALADINALEVGEDRRREIFDWWNDRYLQAVAEANGTFWLRTVDAGQATGATRRRDRSDRALHLTGRAQAELKSMPGSVFAWVVYKCSLVQRQWEREPDARALGRVAHVIDQTSRPEDPYAARRATTMRLIVAVLAAALAGTLQLTASSFTHGLGLVVAVLIIGVLGAFPYGDLLDRWDNRDSQLAAIVRKADVS